jgi:demethylmenaquinone methyltransferase/2-methoxy-6-polyprenyl-1,4-benzoquinol methylase
MLIKDQKSICEMFDRIAHAYDMINRIISFRQDIRWRMKVADQLPNVSEISVLDIATGTADLLIAMCTLRPNITRAFGIDLSENMLLVAHEKIIKNRLQDRITLQRADACSLPFTDASFDVVSIAFGIRNVSRIDDALTESARVLKQNGFLIVLEFSLPENYFVRMLYLLYLRHIPAMVGGLLSNDNHAYRYLNVSVEDFPTHKTFKETLFKNGFKHVEIKLLTLGVAAIYCARKI